MGVDVVCEVSVFYFLGFNHKRWYLVHIRIELFNALFSSPIASIVIVYKEHTQSIGFGLDDMINPRKRFDYLLLGYIGWVVQKPLYVPLDIFNAEDLF